MGLGGVTRPDTVIKSEELVSRGFRRATPSPDPSHSRFAGNAGGDERVLAGLGFVAAFEDVHVTPLCGPAGAMGQYLHAKFHSGGADIGSRHDAAWVCPSPADSGGKD